ncbi:MAG: biopolymer transporter ExbD [Oscillatoriales cyanobacterium]|nr:MAG: biopolymer transporter ExbD [Oscillatoriales cyanobacterium]
MKIHLDTPAEDARIELLPLIDIIFCILTFFLLSAVRMTRQQAINVDLPKAKTGAGLTVLYAPQNAKYAKVVEVLDKLREVGGDRVALATLPSSAPSGQPNDPSLPNSGIPAAPSGNYPQPLPSPLAPGQQQFNPNGFQSPLPAPGQQQFNPNGFQSPLPAPGQQQFNPNGFQSPLPAPGQQPRNSGGNLGIPPVSPAPTAPNFRPGAAAPPPNVPPSN